MENMKCRFNVVFIVSLLFSFSPFSFAAQFFEPDQDIKIIYTDYFNIIYVPPQQKTAEKYAVIAERVHEKMTRFLQWTPIESTDVVLTELSIPAGGIASTMPRNRILLNGRLILDDEAKERLFIHEYTHILHLDKAAGMHLWGRRILGRIPYFFPNQLQPQWLIEGLANYLSNDSLFVASQRRNEYSNNEMRVDLAHEFKPLPQINIGYALRSWPGVWSIYFYGDHFYQFLEEKYGLMSIQEMVNNYSDNPLPYFANYNANQTFDKDLYMLWDEFEIYLHDRFDMQIRENEMSGFDKGEALNIPVGLNTSRFTGDDHNVYFFQSDGVNSPGVFEYNLKNKLVSRLFNTNGWVSLDFHGEKGLLMIQYDYYEQTEWMGDLYIYDFNIKKTKRITYGADCRKAEWHPSLSQIVAVCRDGDNNQVRLLSDKGELLDLLWQGEGDINIYSAIWSPDASKLLLNTETGGQNARLVEFDIKTKSWVYLTTPESDALSGSYIDSNQIVFSRRERNGFVNLTILDKDKNQLRQISNNLGASVTPFYHDSSNSIFYSLYEHDGWRLYQLTLDKAKQQILDIALEINKKDDTNIAYAENFTDINSDRRDYSPLPFLKPTSWWPLIRWDNETKTVGARTYGRTPLAWHAYFVRLQGDVEEQLPEWRFRYVYSRYRPIFEVGSIRSHSKFRDFNGKLVKIRSHTDYNLKVSRAWYKAAYTFQGGGLLSTTYHRDAKDINVNTKRNDVVDKRVASFIRFNNAKFYRDTISAVNGFSLHIAAEQLFDSDFERTDKAAQIDFSMYYQFSDRHVFATKIATGISSRSNDFNLGGVSGGDIVQYLKETICCFRGPAVDDVGLGVGKSFSLRGYPSGLPNITGNKFYLATVEWRFPLFLIERHYMRPPAGLRRFKGSFYADHGAAWSNDSDTVTGVGAEIIFETSVTYRSHANMKLGFARGLNTGGENQIYFRMGGNF